MDGVVKHLPRRDGLLATPPLGASAIIAVSEMSYAVKVSPFKTPFRSRGHESRDCAAPAGGGSLSPPGFHID